MPRGNSGDIDFDRLSDYLKALANPNRLELLHQLRFPRTASEIYLRPKRTESGSTNPDRFISRQAVERHLGILEGIQVIKRQPSTREGRPVEEYVLNHPKVFAIVEEMRKISHIKAHAPIDPMATSPDLEVPAGKAPARKADAPKGPHVLLVAGVFEGRRYALNGDGPWEIGRSADIAVPLDYDPFVSTRNSVLTVRDGRYVVQDVETNRNGTSVNYEPLPKGGECALENGDLVGVGRSLLLFRSA